MSTTIQVKSMTLPKTAVQVFLKKMAEPEFADRWADERAGFRRGDSYNEALDTYFDMIDFLEKHA